MLTSAVAAVACVLVISGESLRPWQSATASDPALRAFIEQTRRDRPEEPLQQASTAESLTLLASAVSSMAQQRGALVRLADDVARLRADIRAYRAGSLDAPQQSARLQRTLTQASLLIHRLVAETRHERRASDPELNALRRSAESLDHEQSLRKQPDVLERFFDHAAAILQRLE